MTPKDPKKEWDFFFLWCNGWDDRNKGERRGSQAWKHSLLAGVRVSGSQQSDRGLLPKRPWWSVCLGNSEHSISSVLDKSLFCKDFYLLYISYVGDVIWMSVQEINTVELHMHWIHKMKWNKFLKKSKTVYRHFVAGLLTKVFRT